MARIISEKKPLPTTMEGIRKLPPATPDKIRERYHHPKIEGLKLLITKAGAKSFTYEGRIKGGETFSMTIGPFPKCGIDTAEKAAKQIAALAAQGIDPREEKRKAKEELTLRELFVWYVAGGSKRPHKPTTLRGYHQTFECYLADLAKLDKRKVSRVTKADIRALHEQMTKDGAETAANRMLALVKAMYNAGRKKDKIDAPNPAEGINLNPETTREVRLYPSQVEGFFKALDSLPQGDMRDFFWLCLLTAQRSGSVKAMRWQDLLLKDKLWIIPDTKNNNPHRVTLPVEAVTILEFRKEEAGKSPFVFPSHSKAGHLVEPKNAWADVLEAAGIDRGAFRIHDLRRTLGSFMGDAGESLTAIGKTLGHMSPLTTAIYARLCVDAQRETHTKGVEKMMANVPGYQIKALDPEHRKRNNRKV